MSYSEAQETLHKRIDQTPKDQSVEEILDSLSWADLAENESHDPRGAIQVGKELEHEAKARLYEETEISICEAETSYRKKYPDGLFPDESSEYDEHVWWLERWVYFRTASLAGQIYVKGKPAVRYLKEDDKYQLGIMRSLSTGGVGYKAITAAGTPEECHTAIRQTRESGKENPTTHRNADVVADGWERLLEGIQ